MFWIVKLSAFFKRYNKQLSASSGDLISNEIVCFRHGDRFLFLGLPSWHQGKKSCFNWRASNGRNSRFIIKHSTSLLAFYDFEIFQWLCVSPNVQPIKAFILISFIILQNYRSNGHLFSLSRRISAKQIQGNYFVLDGAVLDVWRYSFTRQAFFINSFIVLWIYLYLHIIFIFSFLLTRLEFYCGLYSVPKIYFSYCSRQQGNIYY